MENTKDANVIMLVEDNQDDEMLTMRAFKKNNIHNEVMVAHDGVEALDYLMAQGDYIDRKDLPPPKLVILDLKLPKVNGLEVLRQMRAQERTRLIPVVILTSSKEEQDLIESYGLGANSYVQKPVDFDEFSEAVKNLGMYWLLMNESPPNRRSFVSSLDDG